MTTKRLSFPLPSKITHSLLSFPLCSSNFQLFIWTETCHCTTSNYIFTSCGPKHFPLQSYCLNISQYEQCSAFFNTIQSSVSWKMWTCHKQYCCCILANPRLHQSYSFRYFYFWDKFLPQLEGKSTRATLESDRAWNGLPITDFYSFERSRNNIRVWLGC